jgi:hypothetical protein
MGTRNLTAVVMNGEFKIAQYGQWDGYPSGQGVTILNFISTQENIEKLKNALDRVRFMDPEGVDKEMLEAYQKAAPEWSNEPDNRTEEQKRWFSTYISRDIGGEILAVIAGSKDDEMIIKNRTAFAGDSLFCEYAYVVDLDDGVLEVYQGFNKEPVTEGRFCSGDESLEKNDGYQPVKLVKTYSLDDLPAEDQFIKDLEPD